MPGHPNELPNLGIRLHDSQPGSLRERSAAVSAQGFTCVHLALGKVLGPAYMDPAAATPGLASHVVNALNGLDVAVLGCYLNLAHPDESEYGRIQDKYIAHLRMACWMKAGVVGTETGNPNAAYAYQPGVSHSEASLELFIRRLEPVVKTAEKLGAILAIEPVYTHIVSDGARARRVLDAIASPNLQIILDPVNLLHRDNLARRDEVIAQAISLLGKDTAVLHLKDCVVDAQGDVKSVAAGTGLMDYSAVLRFARDNKPHIQMTFENTRPDNAQAAADHIRSLYMALGE